MSAVRGLTAWWCLSYVGSERLFGRERAVISVWNVAGERASAGGMVAVVRMGQCGSVENNASARVNFELACAV